LAIIVGIGGIVLAAAWPFCFGYLRNLIRFRKQPLMILEAEGISIASYRRIFVPWIDIVDVEIALARGSSVLAIGIKPTSSARSRMETLVGAKKIIVNLSLIQEAPNRVLAAVRQQLVRYRNDSPGCYG
jgi:hypothetical protein